MKSAELNIIHPIRPARALHRWSATALGLTALLALAGSLCAGPVYVPNFSFESQVVPFAGPDVDSWQKPPQPGMFDTNVFGAWTNLAGAFVNFPATPDFIENADGAQLGYIFAYPQMALFQDFNSTDWSNAAPSHAFNATFNPGKTYTLTVGITSSTEAPLTQGSTLQLSLYYRDASSNMVTVAATTVTYDTNVFTNLTHLIDFRVKVPIVQPADAWAGKNIGIQILATTAPQLIGGVWDVDNVRLTELVGVPNASFESQVVQFAGPEVDSWQKPPQPVGYDTNIFGAWTNLAGVFVNFPATPDFIDNADGSQLAYLFTYPQLALFQDYNSTDWSGAPPTHAFNAKFVPGNSYHLTVGLTSSSEEPLAPGTTLQLSLYYRDASSNMVTVAATTVTYDTNIFTNLNHLIDFHVNVPTVKSTDAWAGQNIGIQFECTTAPQFIGGVWDLDNVRLVEVVTVPNYSFESQVTDFAGPEVDSWQKPPQPGGFDTNVFGAWTNLAGVFVNFPATPDFIDNADGSQLAYLFAYPQLSLFQDVNSTDWSNGIPTHAFNTKYKPGKSYALTVGLTSSSEEPLTQGSTLQLSFYYRDVSNNMVTVAATTVTYDTNVFTNLTHLIDFKVTVPDVKAGDPWAGQNIGIQFASTVSPFLIGGLWDLDNVRLVETVVPVLTDPGHINGRFSFTLQSDQGVAFDILATTNLTQSTTNWSNIATITNATGSYLFIDPATNLNQRFYRAHQLP